MRRLALAFLAGSLLIFLGLSVLLLWEMLERFR